VHLEDWVLRFKVPVVMRCSGRKMKSFVEEKKKCKGKRKCLTFSGQLNASFHKYWVSTTAFFFSKSLVRWYGNALR